MRISRCSLLLAITMVSLSILSSACSRAERSAGQALDNANEVISAGSDKLWIQDEKKSDESEK